jgi:cation transport ATPase
VQRHERAGRTIGVPRDPSEPARLAIAVAAALLVAGLSIGLLGTGAASDPAGSLRFWLFAAAAAFAAAPVAPRAIAGVRNGHVTMELLVLVAIAGALASGLAWEAAAVAFLCACGGWLEARALRASAAPSGAAAHVDAPATGAASAADAARSIGAPAVRARLRHAVDVLAGWYTPAVLAVAAGALAVTGNIPLALALLVIARPQALLLSTPSALRGAADAQNVAIALAAAVALLVGVVAGELRMAGAMLIQQAAVLAVLLNASRPARA